MYIVSVDFFKKHTERTEQIENRDRMHFHDNKQINYRHAKRKKK